MNFVLLIIGGVVGWFVLVGLFELLVRLDRALSTWTRTKVKFKAAGALSLEMDKRSDTTTPTKETRPLTTEEKAEQDKLKLAKNKELIEGSSMDDDAKKMATKHAERNYGNKLKDMIDGS